jgi:rod shape-determining protein MreB
MSVISVNVGAADTEIAVLHHGEAIISSREKIGGEDFDRAVQNYVLTQGDVNISLLVARAIKEKLGAVWAGRENASIDIEGTLSLTGNRLKMNVTTEDIVGVFEEPIHTLMLAIVEVVKRIPTDAVKEIFENGIILTGGGAELYGLDKLMEKVLGISIEKPQGAIDCVAKGLSRINSFLPEKPRISNKNITSVVSKYYEASKNSSGG